MLSIIIYPMSMLTMMCLAGNIPGMMAVIGLQDGAYHPVITILTYTVHIKWLSMSAIPGYTMTGTGRKMHDTRGSMTRW